MVQDFGGAHSLRKTTVHDGREGISAQRLKTVHHRASALRQQTVRQSMRSHHKT